MRQTCLIIILINATVLPIWGQDYAAPARRIAATTQLAAEEYRLGVRGGRVVAAPEVEEARLFLAEALRNVDRLPGATAAIARAELMALDSMVSGTADPDSVSVRAMKLLGRIASDLKLAFDEIPAEAPSLERGQAIYRSTCAACHGALGGGDGPASPGLNPPATILADGRKLEASSPLDFYRRITVGVAGTTMASFEGTLSAGDRWAVARYASTLRLPPPSGSVPSSLRAFPATARMSDGDVLTALGPGATPAQVAAVRATTAPADASAAVFSEVRARLDSAYQLATAGRGEEARASAMDAYVTFEQVERSLRVKDPKLTMQIEEAFSSLRTSAGAGATPQQLAAIRTDLARALERAERTIGDKESASNLFVQSFGILVREGLEAILVIGALMAFLVKSGNGNRRRDIHIGVGAAVVMSLLTAAALETIFVLSPSHQEALEGAVMIVATITLFYVSYWLLSKVEVAKWNRFVRSKVEQALTGGSALALASAAFLAVYREGFETVLFYKALAVSGGSEALVPVTAGILAGAVVLAGVYFAINRFGVRLPLKPLFGVTSGLLYYVAFVFAGKGVAELQEAGVVPLTPISWAPRVPAMGIYPTFESLAAQGVLVLLAIAAMLWMFVIAPRRLREAPAS
jgi:high-affinity iron transporter